MFTDFLRELWWAPNDCNDAIAVLVLLIAFWVLVPRRFKH